MKHKSVNKTLGAYLAIIGGAALWGIIGIFFNRLLAYGFSPMQIVSIRSFFGAVLITFLLLKTNPQLLKIQFKTMWVFIGTGVLSLLFFNAAYFYTITMSSISVAVLLLYTAPAFVMVMSLFFFGESLNKTKITALIATFIGCACITGIAQGEWQITPWALACGLASGFGYSLYSIFCKFALRYYQNYTITAYTFYFAFIGSLAFANPKDMLIIFDQTPDAILWALGIAFFSTVAPYLLYNYGLKSVDAGQASILATIEPIVGSLVGICIYNEALTAEKLIGMSFIIAAIVILNFNTTKEGK